MAIEIKIKTPNDTEQEALKVLQAILRLDELFKMSYKITKQGANNE